MLIIRVTSLTGNLTNSQRSRGSIGSPKRFWSFLKIQISYKDDSNIYKFINTSQYYIVLYCPLDSLEFSHFGTGMRRFLFQTSLKKRHGIYSIIYITF